MRKSLVAYCFLFGYLGFLSGVFSRSSASQLRPSPEPRFNAKLEIMLDGAKLRKALVQSADVIAALERFYDKSPTFKLSELQRMQIPTADGGKVELRTIAATIDVKFSRVEKQSGKKKRK